ncbi:MAG: hypothetical protein U1F68_11425 [Gammaproteobacteria bacterium]
MGTISAVVLPISMNNASGTVLAANSTLANQLAEATCSTWRRATPELHPARPA